MNRTKIEWCDYTWNPVVGCSQISTGCKNCYAAAISKRFGFPWGQPVLMPNRLEEPSERKKSSKIFVCSMSDLGGADDGIQYVVSESMKAAPQHQFIVLTKRPETLRLDYLPSTVWVGVTVEDMDAKTRWFHLSEHWKGLSFVSVEPMLEPVSFESFHKKPDWVIAGPETGFNARRCEDAWIDALANESPCFFDKRKTGWKRREFPNNNERIGG